MKDSIAVLVRIKSDSDFGKSDFSLTGDFCKSTLFSDLGNINSDFVNSLPTNHMQRRTNLGPVIKGRLTNHCTGLSREADLLQLNKNSSALQAPTLGRVALSVLEYPEYSRVA